MRAPRNTADKTKYLTGFANRLGQIFHLSQNGYGLSLSLCAGDKLVAALSALLQQIHLLNVELRHFLFRIKVALSNAA